MGNYYERTVSITWLAWCYGTRTSNAESKVSNSQHGVERTLALVDSRPDP